MPNGILLVLLKIEIIVFLILFAYCVFYITVKFVEGYGFFKGIVKKKDYTKEGVQGNIEKIVIAEDSPTSTSDFKKQVQQLNEMDKKRLTELLRQIKLNKSRGEYDIAKNLIIEALLIDKFNKDINIELASLYIIENDFLKAEYIYKDLLLVHNDDFEILKKLAFVLSHQEKFDLAIEIYRKAHILDIKDIEILNMLSNLYYYKSDFLNAENFLKKYLKEKPRDTENLYMLALTYKAMGNNQNAIFTLNKILNIEPYNEKAKQTLYEIENPKTNDTEIIT